MREGEAWMDARRMEAEDRATSFTRPKGGRGRLERVGLDGPCAADFAVLSALCDFVGGHCLPEKWSCIPVADLAEALAAWDGLPEGFDPRAADLPMLLGRAGFRVLHPTPPPGDPAPAFLDGMRWRDPRDAGEGDAA